MTEATVHWSETKAGHQQRGKSVMSRSKPEVLFLVRRDADRKEAVAPLRDQHGHCSLVNRTVVLLVS